MHIDFSKIFHTHSKDLRDHGARHIPTNRSMWPEAWKTVLYKIYEKVPKIQLSKDTPAHPFFSLVAQRHSRRQYSDAPLSLEELSTLLKYSCGETGLVGTDGQSKRAQPSGGSRYPIEAYIFIFRTSPDLPAGVYHYEIKKHELALLLACTFSKEDIKKLFVDEWVGGASAAIILTGVFGRTKQKYGQRGYRYALLEAGHIGQNIYLAAEALGIRCCAIAATMDEEIDRLLEIDGEHESIVHSVILGK